MTEPQHRLLEHIQGDGWLFRAGIRLGQVSYVIDVWRIVRSLDPERDGTQLDVRLRHQTLTVPSSDEMPLILHLADGRTVAGFLSADGSRLVRSGPLQPG